jgi:hypothetical protein
MKLWIKAVLYSLAVVGVFVVACVASYLMFRLPHNIGYVVCGGGWFVFLVYTVRGMLKNSQGAK